ncbi:polysaccharide biosynthesis tyrosine autokinase, partial [Patescibacteria group bacterium]|nr:polysaccharide biosynthesis tyrosine autokinase [Patescibacteria group bacterium]
MAKNIVDILTQVSIERDVASRRMETTAALDFISQQVEKTGQELHQTEEKLRDYKEKEGFMQLSTEAKLKVEDLADLESSYESTKISRQENEVRLNEVKKQLVSIDKIWMSSITISNNPIVQMLRTRLTELQIELAQLNRQFSNTAPEVVQVKAKIEEIENQLRDQVETIVSGKTESINPVYTGLYSRLVNYETNLNALRAKEDALSKLVDDYQKEVDKLPLQELELARLERKSRVNEELYTLLLRKKSEVRIQSASEIGSLEVVDPPIVPDNPVKPRKRLNAILSLITGMVCGLGLAFFTEYLDKTIKTEEEVKDLLKLPVLGVIPKLGSGTRYGYSYPYRRGRKKKRKEKKDKSYVKTKIKKKEQEKVETISLIKPKSAISEAYRILRTNLQFVDIEKKMKTLVVTSSIPKEGKTSVAINLAITFALAGERTLLADADFRNPGIHKVFDLKRDPGLTNILTGRESYPSVVKNIEKINGLDILTTGPLPPNPSELLGSIKMKELISKLEGDYDKLIFDTPPSVSLTDASVLSTSVEGTLLVLAIGEVEKEAAERTKEGLKKVKANILGVVLNKLVLERRGYGSYYYYYPQEEDN